tara:strand:+ start:2459 stop:3616 length:1158 start_codon:yes stop_codon:yes gene_type:complete
MKKSNNFKKFRINQKILIFLINSFFLFGCTKEAQIKVFSPAVINTQNIKNISVGEFEIKQIILKYKTERNGIWVTKNIVLDKSYQKSISRSIRARVVNLLTETIYFRAIFDDEFEKIEKDDELNQLVSTKGYRTEKIDAVLNGKIWLEIERTDGVELSKEELEYFRPPLSKRRLGLNLSVDQVVWWPYKSTSGTLGLEIKMMRLNPTEMIASTLEKRTFSQRIGGKHGESFQKISKKLSSTSSPLNSENSIESSKEIIPAFDQIIADLALSIASSFVQRVSITEKIVSYPIANGSSENSKILIEAGAYDLAIEQLQKITENDPNPNDLYNLGLCFEAIGDYGLAYTTYKEAWIAQPENLLFAKGLGRIEILRRERPKLQKQLISR